MSDNKQENAETKNVFENLDEQEMGELVFYIIKYHLYICLI